MGPSFRKIAPFRSVTLCAGSALSGYLYVEAGGYTVIALYALYMHEPHVR